MLFADNNTLWIGSQFALPANAPRVLNATARSGEKLQTRGEPTRPHQLQLGQWLSYVPAVTRFHLRVLHPPSSFYP